MSNVLASTMLRITWYNIRTLQLVSVSNFIIVRLHTLCESVYVVVKILVCSMFLFATPISSWKHTAVLQYGRVKVWRIPTMQPKPHTRGTHNILEASIERVLSYRHSNIGIGSLLTDFEIRISILIKIVSVH